MGNPTQASGMEVGVADWQPLAKPKQVAVERTGEELEKLVNEEHAKDSGKIWKIRRKWGHQYETEINKIKRKFGTLYRQKMGGPIRTKAKTPVKGMSIPFLVKTLVKRGVDISAINKVYTEYRNLW